MLFPPQSLNSYGDGGQEFASLPPEQHDGRAGRAWVRSGTEFDGCAGWQRKQSQLYQGVSKNNKFVMNY